MSYTISGMSASDYFMALYNYACAQFKPRHVEQMRNTARDPELFKSLTSAEAAQAYHYGRISKKYGSWGMLDAHRGVILWFRIEQHWDWNPRRAWLELDTTGYNAIYGRGAALRALAAWAQTEAEASLA